VVQREGEKKDERTVRCKERGKKDERTVWCKERERRKMRGQCGAKRGREER
jgi:hypothetical protein